MTRVSLTEAQERLPELIAAASRGEEVVIEHDSGTVTIVSGPGQPPAAKRERTVRFGLLKDKIHIIDPDWHKPMTDDQLREAFGDDYIG